MLALPVGPAFSDTGTPDYSTPTPPPRPKESALHFTGEKRKVAAVLEAVEAAYRHFNPERLCVDLNIYKPAAAIGDSEALQAIPKCEAALRRLRRQGGIKPKGYEITVTRVRIHYDQEGTDPIGADASGGANVTITDRGKTSSTTATLVRVTGSWYFAYFGPS